MAPADLSIHANDERGRARSRVGEGSRKTHRVSCGRGRGVRQHQPVEFFGQADQRVQHPSEERQDPQDNAGERAVREPAQRKERTVDCAQHLSHAHNERYAPFDAERLADYFGGLRFRSTTAVLG